MWKNNKPKKVNNKGFSLVEVLISIIILVIVMLPLMNNFIRSMQINKKSEIYQTQSNLAASIMEGLKAYSLEELIETFNEHKELFEILSPSSVDSITQLVLDSDDKYVPAPSSEQADSDQATYYFAIHGARAGSSVYDVFIEIDARPYNKDIIVEGNTESILNNYLIPELINLDEKANGILFSDGSNVQSLIRRKNADSNEDIPVEDILVNLDKNVLNLLIEQGTLFAKTTLYQTPKYLNYINQRNQWENEREEAIIKGEPIPAPTFTEPTISDPDLDLLKYTNADDIKKVVTKNMRVTVSDKNLQYEIEYVCDFNDGIWKEIRMTHNIDQIEYFSTLENIYLAYVQSIFHETHPADKIYIKNNDISNSINFFVADQGNIILHYPITIDRQAGDSIAVHTDINQYEPYVDGVEVVEEYPGLIKTYELNRIFDITIDISKAEIEQDNRYKEVYYTLKSTKER